MSLELESCVVPERYGIEVKKLFSDLEFRSFLGLDIFTEEAKLEDTDKSYPEIVACKSYDEIISLIGSEREYGIVLNDNCAEIYVGGKQLSVKNCVDLMCDGISLED